MFIQALSSIYTTPILMRRVVRVDKTSCKLLPGFIQKGLECVWGGGR